MSVGDKASVGSVRETFEDLLVAHEWGGGDLLSKVLTSNKLYTSVGVGEHHITGDPSSSSAAAVVAAERIWICNELNDATDAAETVWREAIRGFEKELRQRELEKRVAPHAILEAILMSELFLECALNICDRTDEQGKTAIQIEDPEPVNNYMRCYSTTFIVCIPPFPPSLVHQATSGCVLSSTSSSPNFNGFFYPQRMP